MLGERHDELVLQKSGGAVDPVPVRDDVEGMEELGDVLDFADAMPGRLAVPELAERLAGGAVD